MTSESSLERLLVLPPRSRAEQLAETLAAHIEARGLAPGDRVGTLEEIRGEVGFARTTVSEAVRLLRERGLLEIRPGRGGGLFVADPTPVVRLRHSLLQVTGSPASVRDAIELREWLEEPVARAAAQACDERDLTELRAAVTRMREFAGQGRFDEFMQANWGLHELVAARCPNTMLASVYTSCLGYISRQQSRYGSEDELVAYLLGRADVHAELVEGIAAADPAAIHRAALAHNDAPDPTRAP